MVKKKLWGKIRYKSVIIINQSQNQNQNFSHFPDRFGGGGGSTQAVALTAFSQFFLPLPLSRVWEMYYGSAIPLNNTRVLIKEEPREQRKVE